MAHNVLWFMRSGFCSPRRGLYLLLNLISFPFVRMAAADERLASLEATQFTIVRILKQPILSLSLSCASIFIFIFILPTDALKRIDTPARRASVQ